jgi:hypothetical protein
MDELLAGQEQRKQHKKARPPRSKDEEVALALL